MTIAPPPPPATKQTLIKEIVPSGSSGLSNNNLLMGSPPANQLVGAPPSVAPAQPVPPQAGALPQRQASQGRQMADAIAKHIQTVPPDKLAREEQRADYLVHAYGTLARKPDLTRKDAIAYAAQAVADGKATPQEAAEGVTGLPEDPAKLRALMQQRFKAAIISASLLQGSAAAAAPAANQR